MSIETINDIRRELAKLEDHARKAHPDAEARFNVHGLAEDDSLAVTHYRSDDVPNLYVFGSSSEDLDDMFRKMWEKLMALPSPEQIALRKFIEKMEELKALAGGFPDDAVDRFNEIFTQIRNEITEPLLEDLRTDKEAAQ